MPTGYTCRVQDTEDLPFEEFLWDCARAFGALIHMRDDSMDEKIKLPEESDWHKNSLKEAQSKLEKFQKMTLAQAKVERDQEHARAQKNAKESLAEKLQTRKRYERMIKLVEAWTPPTSEHKGLKEFMLSQLNNSVNFDCNNDYYEGILKKKMVSPKEWLAAAIADAKHDIDYHTKKAQEEHEETLKRIEWIMQLQHSVPIPKKNKKGKK